MSLGSSPMVRGSPGKSRRPRETGTTRGRHPAASSHVALSFPRASEVLGVPEDGMAFLLHIMDRGAWGTSPGVSPQPRGRHVGVAGSRPGGRGLDRHWHQSPRCVPRPLPYAGDSAPTVPLPPLTAGNPLHHHREETAKPGPGQPQRGVTISSAKARRGRGQGAKMFFLLAQSQLCHARTHLGQSSSWADGAPHALSSASSSPPPPPAGPPTPLSGRPQSRGPDRT